jgi:hypothetical protein
MKSRKAAHISTTKKKNFKENLELAIGRFKTCLILETREFDNKKLSLIREPLQKITLSLGLLSLRKMFGSWRIFVNKSTSEVLTIESS